MLERDLSPIPAAAPGVYPRIVNKNPKLICIVDDDASVRSALGRMVKSLGFDVRLFASARECLDRPDIDRAACLILDVSMPGMDGFKLHALLKESNRSVPTVFISAHDDKYYTEKARSIGAIAFLNKPCEESLLLGAIEKALAA
jgi:FixJ family two-component response regulator